MLCDSWSSFISGEGGKEEGEEEEEKKEREIYQEKQKQGLETIERRQGGQTNENELGRERANDSNRNSIMMRELKDKQQIEGFQSTRMTSHRGDLSGVHSGKSGGSVGAVVSGQHSSLSSSGFGTNPHDHGDNEKNESILMSPPLQSQSCSKDDNQKTITQGQKNQHGEKRGILQSNSFHSSSRKNSMTSLSSGSGLSLSSSDPMINRDKIGTGEKDHGSSLSQRGVGNLKSKSKPLLSKKPENIDALAKKKR